MNLSIEERFTKARADVAAFLVARQMYYTLSLLGCCSQTITEDVPSLAGITNVNGLQLFIHPFAIHMLEEEREAYMYMIVHEIHHLIQLANFSDMDSIISLSPMRDVFVSKRNQATDPNAKAIWQKHIDACDDTSPKSWASSIKRRVANVGMDTAANAVNDKLFPTGRKKLDVYLGRFITEVLKKKPEEPPRAYAPDMLSEIIGEPLLPDYEWYYYAMKYLEWLAKQEDENNPDANNPPPIIECSVGTGDGQDSHAFGDGDKEQEAAGRQAARDAVERAKKEAAILAHAAGTKAADMDFVGKEVVLDPRVKAFIQAIKVKFNLLFSPSNEEEYRFDRFNRVWPNAGLPGPMFIDKPVPNVVMVIDTSGSMWEESLMNQMIAVGRHYFKKNMLNSLYCCDTELTKVDFDASFRTIKLKGGGGTEFSSKQVEQIFKDIGSSVKRIDIIYATDEMVYGLDEVKNNKKVNLHIVNVPKIMGN